LILYLVSANALFQLVVQLPHGLLLWTLETGKLSCTVKFLQFVAGMNPSLTLPILLFVMLMTTYCLHCPNIFTMGMFSKLLFWSSDYTICICAVFIPRLQPSFWHAVIAGICNRSTVAYLIVLLKH